MWVGLSGGNLLLGHEVAVPSPFLSDRNPAAFLVFVFFPPPRPALRVHGVGRAELRQVRGSGEEKRYTGAVVGSPLHAHRRERGTFGE